MRFLALMHATGDRRLLQMLAEPFGLVVIEARYLPAIEDALLDDKIAELNGVPYVFYHQGAGVSSSITIPG